MRTCFLILFFSVPLWAGINYADLCRKASPDDLRQLLREYELRKAEPFSELSQWYLAPPIEGIQAILLAKVQGTFIHSQSWLDKVSEPSLLALKILWKRALSDENFAAELQLASYVNKHWDQGDPALKSIILKVCAQMKWTELVKNLPPVEGRSANADELFYRQQIQAVIPDSWLKLNEKDGSYLAEIQARVIKEQKKLPMLEPFVKAANPQIRAMALCADQLDGAHSLLQDESLWVRSQATQFILKRKWDAELALQAMKSASTIENTAVYEAILKFHEQIEGKWVLAHWDDISNKSKWLLLEMMAQHPSAEWWTLVESRLEAEKVAQVGMLKMMTYLPHEGHAPWLFALVKKSAFADHQTQTLSMEVLELWDQPLPAAELVQYFHEFKFVKGRAGGSSLVILLGKNPSPDGNKIISRELTNHKAAYPQAAVKAAGFAASPDLVNSLKKYYENKSVDEIDDALGRWALRRCMGENVEFPILNQLSLKVPVELFIDELK